ncbi:MAG: TIGR03936 family radical SAM-associated protein [Firmicutes bacterium]|nr:TIGR03936 family radical SAM-associated protein [Bacillota bacterium]
MLLFKYAKVGSAVYTPHLVLMHSFTMAIRRCGLSVRFSEGFNPHERIFFAPPLPIGTASECEYFSVDSSENPQDSMKRLNGSLQEGVTILKAAERAENPNFAAVSYAAEYEITQSSPPPCVIDLKNILAQDKYEISFEQKGETVKKDVRGLIFDLKISEIPHSSLLTPNYLFTLACGNQNLRADRLMRHLLKSVGQEDAYFTVTKKRLFDKNFVDIDTRFF